jgi:hypothetical protein
MHSKHPRIYFNILSFEYAFILLKSYSKHVLILYALPPPHRHTRFLPVPRLTSWTNHPYAHYNHPRHTTSVTTVSYRGLFYGGTISPYTTVGKKISMKGSNGWATYTCGIGWYIGGMRVSLEVLSRWHKRNIDFSISICFHFFSSNMVNFVYFDFKFQKWKFSIFSFQISKMKISIFSFEIFVAYFNIFHFPLMVVWPHFFKFQNRFLFQICSFPSGGIAKFSFSKFKNKKIQFEFQNRIFFISNFPYGIYDFFLSQRLANLLKDCNNYLFTFKK